MTQQAFQDYPEFKRMVKKYNFQPKRGHCGTNTSMV